ncbi:MAG: hypothetical protein AW07_01216 [Candidatus Accumulibacter sp. SK-11]|nr:MAG: hypothetical protein AW07_01216 [Candidatus Accumulibacter sp. SK-11]
MDAGKRAVTGSQYGPCRKRAAIPLARAGGGRLASPPVGRAVEASSRPAVSTTKISEKSSASAILPIRTSASIVGKPAANSVTSEARCDHC